MPKIGHFTTEELFARLSALETRLQSAGATPEEFASLHKEATALRADLTAEHGRDQRALEHATSTAEATVNAARAEMEDAVSAASTKHKDRWKILSGVVRNKAPGELEREFSDLAASTRADVVPFEREVTEDGRAIQRMDALEVRLSDLGLRARNQAPMSAYTHGEKLDRNWSHQSHAVFAAAVGLLGKPDPAETSLASELAGRNDPLAHASFLHAVALCRASKVEPRWAADLAQRLDPRGTPQSRAVVMQAVAVAGTQDAAEKAAQLAAELGRGGEGFTRATWMQAVAVAGNPDQARRAMTLAQELSAGASGRALATCVLAVAVAGSEDKARQAQALAKELQGDSTVGPEAAATYMLACAVAGSPDKARELRDLAVSIDGRGRPGGLFSHETCAGFMLSGAIADAQTRGANARVPVPLRED